MATDYGVYREMEGTAERALFVLDGDGVVVWSYVSPIDVNPGADGILRALESLPNGDRKVSDTRSDYTKEPVDEAAAGSTLVASR